MPQVIHLVAGDFTSCSRTEHLNATTEREQVTCRSCLRIMLRHAERGALLYGTSKTAGKWLEKLKRARAKRGRPRFADSVTEAFQMRMGAARDLRRRLGLPEDVPVYQPDLVGVETPASAE